LYFERYFRDSFVRLSFVNSCIVFIACKTAGMQMKAVLIAIGSVTQNNIYQILTEAKILEVALVIVMYLSTSEFKY